jgi:hypothetical protein
MDKPMRWCYQVLNREEFLPLLVICNAKCQIVTTITQN